jgi:hypothetical protein
MLERFNFTDAYLPHVAPFTTEATTVVADTRRTQSRLYQTLDLGEQLVLLSLVFLDAYNLKLFVVLVEGNVNSPA